MSRELATRLDTLERIWPSVPPCPVCTPVARTLLVGGDTPPEPNLCCPECNRPWLTVVHIVGIDVDDI